MDYRVKNSTFTWTIGEKAWTIGEQGLGRIACNKGISWFFLSTVIISNNYSNGGMVASLTVATPHPLADRYKDSLGFVNMLWGWNFPPTAFQPAPPAPKPPRFLLRFFGHDQQKQNNRIQESVP